ncbi:hypothetical protein L596_015507 [Steinernema carpocapsae]|uniref:Uncharacterized protein n=1 Tax=Steinernema carpocapsae TaxID=34508 RepID=A0A4U5NG73_STECR|nr:hypothetical protein L596_015507 [Steinernema carpocapsae]
MTCIRTSYEAAEALMDMFYHANVDKPWLRNESELDCSSPVPKTTATKPKGKHHKKKKGHCMVFLLSALCNST